MDFFSGDDSYGYEYDYDYSSSLNLTDDYSASNSQPEHYDKPNESEIPDPIIPDPNIAICHSLGQTKKLITSSYQTTVHQLHRKRFPGLAIIPLCNICMIREDKKNILFRNAIFIPATDDYKREHPELAALMEEINK